MIESTVFPIPHILQTTRNRQCSTYVSRILYAYKIDYSLCIIDCHLIHLLQTFFPHACTSCLSPFYLTTSQLLLITGFCQGLLLAFRNVHRGRISRRRRGTTVHFEIFHSAFVQMTSTKVGAVVVQQKKEGVHQTHRQEEISKIDNKKKTKARKVVFPPISSGHRIRKVKLH